jgi:hypothetical protein
MGAYRVAPYAVHIDRGGGRSADRNSKPDVRATDIRDQPEYPGRIEILDNSDFVSNHICAGTFRASGRFVHCHHFTPTGHTEKGQRLAAQDSAVNQGGSGFYRVIDQNVAQALLGKVSFDNAV